MCKGACGCLGHLSFGVLQEVHAKMDLQVPEFWGEIPVKDKRGGRETLRPQCCSDTCERRGEGRRVGRRSLRKSWPAHWGAPEQRLPIRTVTY